MLLICKAREVRIQATKNLEGPQSSLEALSVPHHKHPIYQHSFLSYLFCVSVLGPRDGSLTSSSDLGRQMEQCHLQCLHFMRKRDRHMASQHLSPPFSQ